MNWKNKKEHRILENIIKVISEKALHEYFMKKNPMNILSEHLKYLNYNSIWKIISQAFGGNFFFINLDSKPNLRWTIHAILT